MAGPSSRGDVVIVGGGVAALETLMALRDLVAEHVTARHGARLDPAPEGFVDLEVPLEATDAAPVGR
jgi:hypothetical protein